MSDDMHRDIGRLEEAVSTLKAEAAAMRNDLADMRSDLAEIKTILAQAKGGWRTLIAVGTFAGGIGAALVKAYTMLKAGVS